MGRLEFSGTIEAGRGGGAFVVLPDEVLSGLGGGGRFRVSGTLNGVSLETRTAFRVSARRSAQTEATQHSRSVLRADNCCLSSNGGSWS